MEKMSDKILKWVAITAAFSVLAVPFIVTNSLLFPYVTGKNFFFRIVTEIGFAAWLLLAVRNASVRPRMSLLLIAFFVFLVVVGIADICGVNPWKSFWSNFERMEGYITLLHLFLYFIVIGTLFSEKIWERFWICSVGAGVMVSLLGVFQFLVMRYPALQHWGDMWGLVRPPQIYDRIDATFENSSYLASYLIFNIFFTILLCARNQAILSRTLLMVALILEITVLYLTATRGAILGCICGFLAFFALKDLVERQETWKRKLSPYVFFAVLGAAFIFIAARDTAFIKNSPVLSRFANTSWSSDDGRQFIWPIALRAFADHPLLGRGQEGFNDAFSTHYDIRYTVEWIDRAHDVVLDWLVSAGILGLLAYLSIFAAALRLLWKRSGISSTEKAVMSGLLCAYFLNNLFTFDTVASYFLFMTVIGYIHFRSTGQTRSLWEGLKVFRGADAGPFAIGIVVMSVFFIYVFNWTALQTCISLVDAHRALAAGNLPRELSAFERAILYNHPLGREEVVDQLLNAAAQMNRSVVSPDTRETFFEMSKKVVDAQVASNPEYLRYEVVASRFYAAFGKKTEEEKYLKKAAEILSRRHVSKG